MICKNCFGTGVKTCEVCNGLGEVPDVSEDDKVFDRMKMACMYLKGINVCNNRNMANREVLCAFTHCPLLKKAG